MDHLKKAVEVLNDGGIVIFPTDTAFGVGTRLDRTDSIARLFKIRKRPVSQATPVLINSISMAQKYWLSPLPDIVRHLINKYWPGGLTIIYKCQIKSVPPLVRAASLNIGLRMPNHKITLSLIKGVRVPVLGPSANFHGESTPYRFKDLDPEFIKLVDYVIPGECQIKVASTVIDCTVNPYNIIRQGAVKLMKHIILIIDTSDNSKTVVGLVVNGKKYLIIESLQKASQNLLSMIDTILQKHKLQPRDITAVQINNGPGSFTGLRVGIAVANTLGYIFKIPINQNNADEQITPIYG